jgi:hypothetical protein
MNKIWIGEHGMPILFKDWSSFGKVTRRQANKKAELFLRVEEW